MKKFLIISWSLFGVALIMRFAHWPGSALLLIISVLLLMIHATTFAIKNSKTDIVTVLLHFSFWSWTTYFLFRIQYWTYSDKVRLVAIAISIGWILILAMKRTGFRLPQFVLSAYILFCMWLSFLPSHHIYYLFNLNSVLYAESREFNYYAWDKYSWFLYSSGEYDAATDASEKAVTIVIAAANNGDQDAASAQNGILNHRAQIALNNWEEWTPPYGY